MQHVGGTKRRRAGRDIITKEYMENPVVFADAFNQFLYHGEQKIDPALLTELDTTGIVVPYGASGASVPEQKYRDVLKLLYAMTDGRTAYCVMGIENIPMIPQTKLLSFR